MFSSGGTSVRFLTRYDGEVSEHLVGRQGSPVSMRVARGSVGGSVIKNSPANAGDTGFMPESGKIPWRRKWPPGCSSILAWEIPWTEEPGELQSMRSQKSRARISD